jgi:osmoprotectant transport system permease protein
LAVRAGVRLQNGQIGGVTDLPAHLVQHCVLAACALAVALLGGLPLGVLAARSSWLRGPLVGAAGIGRTVPSLAVLMLVLPWLGVGTLPAVAALALLAIPPIVINVDLAIRGVAASALDAATGMGMTGLQRFLRIVVPSALPVSLVGIRTATTETIASATLATFVGAGGLGDDIVRGLQTDDASLLLSAAAVVAALALVADLALAAASRRYAAR